MADFTLIAGILKILREAGALIKEKPPAQNIINNNRSIIFGGHVVQNFITVEDDKIPSKKARKRLQKILKGQAYSFDTPELTKKKALISGHEKTDPNFYNFVTKSLPLKDQALWKAGLLLRQYFKSGENELVVQIKNDMVQTDQIRGKNIANLCTAGYLESEIIPMHEKLTDLERSEDFTKFYEALVTQTPTSVFVGVIHNEKSLRVELLNKIEYAKKYSAPYIKVHALGRHNVELAIKILKEVREKSEIEDVYYPASPSHLDATIALKTKISSKVN